MEIKKGVCIQSKLLRNFDGQQGGTMYVHGVAFRLQDGGVTSGEYISKSDVNSKFIINQEHEFEFYPELNPEKQPRIKVPQNPAFAGGGGYASGAAVSRTQETPEDRNRSFALSYAKDCAELFKCKTPGDVIFAAEEFLQWLNNKPVSPADVFEKELNKPEVNDDDLPF